MWEPRRLHPPPGDMITRVVEVRTLVILPLAELQLELVLATCFINCMSKLAEPAMTGAQMLLLRGRPIFETYLSYVHVYMYVYVWTICIWIDYTYVHTCTRTCIYSHIYIHIYIHIQIYPCVNSIYICAPAGGRGTAELPKLSGTYGNSPWLIPARTRKQNELRVTAFAQTSALLRSHNAVPGTCRETKTLHPKFSFPCRYPKAEIAG